MTEEKRRLKVFLCHASADKQKVRELCKRLKDDNVDVWLDEEKILPGYDWDLEISKAIRVADVILVVLSKYSVSKEGYVQKEIKRALDIADEKPEGTIFIIPVRLDECEVPERLQCWHWVKLFLRDSYEILIKALTVRADQIGVFAPRQKNGKPRKKFIFPLVKIEYFVAIIGAAATIVAGLLSSPLIERWFPPAFMPTVTITYTAPAPTETALATHPTSAAPASASAPFAVELSTTIITPTAAYVTTVTPYPTLIKTATQTVTPTPAKIALPTSNDLTCSFDSGSGGKLQYNTVCSCSRESKLSDCICTQYTIDKNHNKTFSRVIIFPRSWVESSIQQWNGSCR